MKWFVSDLHFNQVNIIKDLSKWEHASPKSLRDFKNVTHMNESIIENINSCVSKHDELYILGDVYFGKDINELQELIRSIKCINKHLILGNHDYLIIKEKERCSRLFSTINNYLEVRVSYPLPGTNPRRDKWKGKQLIVLSHYAMRVWNGSHRGSWMLYGHSHASLDDLDLYEEGNPRRTINEYYLNSKTFDVGLDNINRILGEYRPISFDEVGVIMKDKVNLYIDHHEK